MKRSGHTDQNAQAIPAALGPATTRYRGAERVERENTNRKGRLRWLDALIASARCEGLVIRWRGYVLARDRRAAAAPREAPPRGRTSGVRWGDRRVEGRSAAAANAKYYPTLPVLRALRRAKYSSARAPRYMERWMLVLDARGPERHGPLEAVAVNGRATWAQGPGWEIYRGAMDFCFHMSHGRENSAPRTDLYRDFFLRN